MHRSLCYLIWFINISISLEIGQLTVDQFQNRQAQHTTLVAKNTS